jgi:hypothetical protein
VSSASNPALEAAVDQFLAETGGADGGAVTDGEPQPTEGTADATPAPDDKATPAETSGAGEGEIRESLALLARQQARWTQEQRQLKDQVRDAEAAAAKRIMDALSSEDPDSALERLGVDPAKRRALAQRLVLRHVPEDQAPEGLRQSVREQALRAELAQTNRRLDEFLEAQQREREEAHTQRAQAEALDTMHKTFEGAEDAKYLAKRYRSKTGRDRVMQDAIVVGREMFAEGALSGTMPNQEIARRIARRLNEQYAEEFGELAPTGASAPATGKPNGTNGTSSKAGDAGPARTIARGQTGVSRASPTGPPRSEDDDLNAMAAEFASMRRAGQLA